MRAMILAAGIGERMRPLTFIKPKPLLEVGGTSLIEHHIINLKKAGYNKIVINVSWLAQQIMQKLGDGSQYGVEIRYSSEGDEPLETGGGIYKALPLIGKQPFLVVNGDIKTDMDFNEIKYNHNSLAHLVLVKNPAHNLDGDFSLASDASLSFENTVDNCYTFSGIGIYHPRLFTNCNHGKFSVVPLLKQAMQQQLVTGQLFQGQWDDIGTIDRLIEININCS
ncbi:Nucleotidyl transferase possibly involved in threonylcarbamoyladenosine formation [hydrothermal vent metagenome]|uniref:Nucleotidyl transferase possibly involved in threonylcarbamoyladenosine formation n=1 Tax=hydrothermal vent metagenome TaxID=652676 RepID=A0A3B0VY70_9ZZZZ